MFELFVIVVYEFLNCPLCEKMDLKIILLERSKICRNYWKTKECAGPGVFFLKNSGTNKGFTNYYHRYENSCGSSDS